jgi:hypothetical protein
VSCQYRVASPGSIEHIEVFGDTTLWKDDPSDGVAEKGALIMKTKLVWDAEWLPPMGMRKVIEAAVRIDIKTRLSGLSHPSVLIAHHSFLTEDHHGPMVFVYGVPGSDKFHCRYDPNPIWSEKAADVGDPRTSA